MRKLCIVILLLVAVDAMAQGFIWSKPRKRVVAVGGAGPSYWTDPYAYAGLWEMETTNTTQTLNTSGSGTNHMTIMPNVATGAARYESGTNQFGRVEHAYSMDGSSDYFSCVGDLNTMNLSQSYIMVGAWFKWNADSTYDTIISFSDTAGDHLFALRRQSVANRIDFATYETAYAVVSNTANVTFGDWHFIAGFKSNTTGRLFYDGAWVATSDVKNVTLNTQTTIGALYAVGSVYTPSCWNGHLDNVFVITNQPDMQIISDIYTYTHPTNNLRERP